MITKAVWERFLEGLAAESVPAIIIESWQRSRQAGVDPAIPTFRKAAPADLEARLSAHRDLILEVVPELLRLLAFLPKPNVAYLIDSSGVVLHSLGTSPENIEKYGLAPGHDWSERAMGTNGAGTALASRKPVAVIGCAHYCAAWHDVACMASPLYGPDGALVGAIDVTIPAEAAEPVHLAEVVRSAHNVERRLRGDRLEPAGIGYRMAPSRSWMP